MPCRRTRPPPPPTPARRTRTRLAVSLSSAAPRLIVVCPPPPPPALAVRPARQSCNPTRLSSHTARRSSRSFRRSLRRPPVVPPRTPVIATAAGSRNDRRLSHSVPPRFLEPRRRRAAVDCCMPHRLPRLSVADLAHRGPHPRLASPVVRLTVSFVPASHAPPRSRPHRRRSSASSVTSSIVPSPIAGVVRQRCCRSWLLI